MLIGTGMIATAFNHYENNDEVIIFASGVSNSKENDDEKFLKEMRLLLKSVKTTKRFIYFSTISIDDKSLSKSKYVNHKLLMENIIKTSFSNYLIFRLPNVIGETKNKNTLFNFFKDKITNQEEILVQPNASRYIIDIEDVSNYLTRIIDSDLKNKIINVCFNEKYKITELIDNFEKALNIKANIKLVNGGCDYVVDNKEFMSLISPFYKKHDNYVLDAFTKYLKKEQIEKSIV